LKQRIFRAGHPLTLDNQPTETVVAWNKKTGQPVSNALCGNATAAMTSAKQLIEAGKKLKFNKKTGLKIDSYFSGPDQIGCLKNSDEMQSGRFRRACNRDDGFVADLEFD
jgi:glycerol kinase